MKTYGLKLRVIGSVAVPGVMALLLSAPATSMAAAVPASERTTASAILAPAPGERVTARVVPRGCNRDACSYLASASNPDAAMDASAATATPTAAATSVNGARVTVVSTGPATGEAPNPLTTQLAAAVNIRFWVTSDDRICSVAGCFFWEMQLNSKAYCDGTYAWGSRSRSRYGYAGYANISGTKGSGYAISSSYGFAGDPSRVDLYAYHHGSVSVVANGAPVHRSYYLHRHYPGNCGRATLVVG